MPAIRPTPLPTTSPLAARCAADPRLRLRRDGPLQGDCVVLWMQRAQRAHANPALDFAIEIANELGVPVRAFLGPVPFYPRANLRAYAFLFGGVPDLARDLAERGVGFTFRPYPDHRLAPFVAETRAALVVGDENPMREPAAWRDHVAARLTVPFVTVDADVLVPTALFPKREFAARTLRPKYLRVRDDWLRPPPHPLPRVKAKAGPRGADPSTAAVPADWTIDRSVAPVATFPPGPREGRKALETFVKKRLRGYAEDRNQPDLAATSRLSPYVHFGHLGATEVAWAVADADAPDADRDAFLEEFLVRRELAINYVAREPRYDELAGSPAWALKSLDEHRKDPRPYLYDDAAFERGLTHDPLWNAAQLEMVRTGHMHGYVRMYWAKKILEWSRTPEEAFALAVRLNDAYELDGRDPNGYTGVAWAIGGLHDRPWAPARPVFGMVRFMSGASTGRKFDSKAYMARVDALAPR